MDNKEKILTEIENKAYTVNHLFGSDTVVSLDVVKQILTAHEGERYQIATEVYGEYAEEIAKEYDETPNTKPFQNWLAQQEKEDEK